MGPWEVTATCVICWCVTSEEVRLECEHAAIYCRNHNSDLQSGNRLKEDDAVFFYVGRSIRVQAGH